MFKKVLLLLLTLAMPIFLFAQSTGKIMGVVKDKDTGEPLPGVNVIIQDTYFGATTDIDGYYVILNVPVGAFSVEASYVGYTKAIYKNIRVSAGQTTEQNFELQSTTLELGEAVVVTAERPLVEKHVTQSVAKVNSEQLDELPVRGITAVLALQPSVVVQDGALHIRGGRSDEVGYYLDGASTVDPVSNTNAVYVIHDAVEEIQVLAGGYTAEFGGANSGIVRSELRSGTRDYRLSLDFQTDKFVGIGEEFLGTQSWNDHILIGTFSGPLGTDKIRLFAAVENNFEGDFQKRFTKSFRFNESNLQNPLIDDQRGSKTFGDTIPELYYPNYTPDNQRNRWTVNSTLLFDYNPIQVRISALYNQRTYTNDGLPVLHILNDRNQYTDARNLLLSAKLTHILNPTSFYNLKVSYFDDYAERKDDYFGSDWRSWSDSAKVYEHTNGDVVFRDAAHGNYSYLLNGFSFSQDGTLKSGWYNKNSQNYISGSMNYVSQINRHNEIKAGFDARYYTVRNFSIYTPTALDRTQFYGSEEAVPVAAWAEALGSRNYGYDRFGNETDKGQDAARTPLFASFYIQDKIEFDNLIINAGLRYDYFDTDDKTLIHPDDPAVNEAEALIKDEAWRDLDPFQYISPRLGMSFPISEKTVFYTQYGRFVQTPKLSHIYRSYNELGTQIVTAGNYYTAPIAYGLEPIETTSYEIGFRQQVGEVASFDITGFYKNLKGQIGSDRVTAAPNSSIQTYDRLANGDFATTKGLEFKMIMRRFNRLQAQLNYTYTIAEGTGSGENSYHAASYRNTAKPTITSPLDYNQKHRGSINLDYRFGENDGGPIFSGFGANLLYTFSSGHPFTLVDFSLGQVNGYDAGVNYMSDTRSREALEPINSSSTPWTSNIDLRLDKSFKVLDNLKAQVYVRVTNLLNTKNIINVFQATGSAQDDGFINDPTKAESFINTYGGQDYIDMYKAINLENGQAYWSATGMQLYGNPRQVMVGMKLIY